MTATAGDDRKGRGHALLADSAGHPASQDSPGRNPSHHRPLQGLRILRGVLSARRARRCPQEFNAKGYHYPEVVEAENCVDCDLCEVICPDFAIFCLPAEDESEHRAAKEAGDAVS